MTDRIRVEALLTATSNRYMQLMETGITEAHENYWLGKIAGIRACLSFMDPKLTPIPEPETISW